MQPRGLVVADGAGRGLRVELVRVVEHGGLGGACGLPVVMAGDGVQELRERRRRDLTGALLDHAEAEVNVSEQAALLGLTKCRPAAELADPADVVE